MKNRNLLTVEEFKREVDKIVDASVESLRKKLQINKEKIERRRGEGRLIVTSRSTTQP